MPIPTPSDKETKDDFISRCMGNDVMNSEFPDKKQRFAVCQSKWEHKKKKAEQDEEIKEMRQDPESLVEKALEDLNTKE